MTQHVCPTTSTALPSALRRFIMASAIGLAVEVHVFAADDVTEGQSPVEYFKAFLASPPIVEHLLWRKIVAHDHHKGLPASEDANSPDDSVAWYYARWQPGHVFLKSSTGMQVRLPGKQTGEAILARNGDHYEMLDRQGLATVWDAHLRTPMDINAAPAFAFQHRSDELAELLNMGVMQLEIGAIHWQGNNFIAKGCIAEEHMPVTIKGALTVSPDQHARELHVDYYNRHGVYEYIERYTYTTNVGLSYLPNLIETYLIRNGRTTKLAELTLLSITTSSHRLAATSFDLTPIIGRNYPQQFFYSNHAWYARNALGHLALLPTPALTGARSAPRYIADDYLYYAAVGVGTLAAFALVWRTNRTAEPNSKHQREL